MSPQLLAPRRFAKAADVLLAPSRFTSAARLMSVCAACGSLCEEVTPGMRDFRHVSRACKECFGTGRPCPYPELHGLHEYSEPSVTNGELSFHRVKCGEAVASQCSYTLCGQVLDASENPCPDHSGCCGHCC